MSGTSESYDAEKEMREEDSILKFPECHRPVWWKY